MKATIIETILTDNSRMFDLSLQKEDEMAFVIPLVALTEDEAVNLAGAIVDAITAGYSGGLVWGSFRTVKL